MKELFSFILRTVPRKYIQLVAHFAMRILAVFYRGNRVECNVCGSTFRTFLPYGRNEHARDNALCPNCLSLERHRLLHIFLHKKTTFFTQPHKVLHVAPEWCFIKRFDQLPNLDYITADLESPLAKVKMDIHDIPFGEHEFDVVFCNHVLEHVEDDRKVMSEFFRVLKPGGWAILQTPIELDRPVTYEDASIKDPKAREKAFGQDDHVRIYGRDYADRLRSVGFTVTEDKLVQELPISEVERFGLPKDEIIYFCKK